MKAQDENNVNEFDPFDATKSTQCTCEEERRDGGSEFGRPIRRSNSEELGHRTRAKAFSVSSMTNGGGMMSCFALRLNPGDELRKELLKFVESKRLKAAFLLSCVGSSQCAKLRLASATSEDENYVLDLVGPHEIVSLTGTLSDGGHLHASLANQGGKVQGGHLLELIVHTTAEIVIGECTALVFKRELDKKTEFRELVVTDR